MAYTETRWEYGKRWRIQKQGEKQDISYYFSEQSDNSIEVVSDTQEVSSEETVDSTHLEDTRQESVTPDADNSKETETMLSILKDLDSLKSFQEAVEKKLFDLEKALISNQTTPVTTVYARVWLVTKMVHQILY